MCGDGSRVLSCSRYGDVLSIWQVPPDAVRRFGGGGYEINALAIDRKGLVALTRSKDGVHRLLEVDTGRVQYVLHEQQAVQRSVGVQLDAVCAGYTLRVRNAGTLDELARVVLDAAPRAYLITSDDRTVIVGDAAGRLHFLRLVMAGDNSY